MNNTFSGLFVLAFAKTSTNKNPIHIFSAAQTYDVFLSITDSCGSIDSTCKVLYFTIGLKELQIEKLKIYPNTAKDYIKISFDNTRAIKRLLEIKLITIDGRMALNSNYDLNESNTEKTIDISTIPKGIYQIQIWINNQVIAKEKVLKI